MSSCMSRILDSLYIGGESDSENKKQMTSNKITQVVRIGDTPTSTWRVELEPQPAYLLISACDRPHCDLTRFYQVVNNFAHSARLQGGVVLIHCFAGVSRSVALAVAYLMSVSQYGAEDVLRFIQQRQYIAYPNQGFRNQLTDFEKKGLQAERQRLFDKFGLKADEDRLGDNGAIKGVLEQVNAKKSRWWKGR